MPARESLDLMRLHAETLFVHDAAGALIRVNEPDGGPAPRFFLGVTQSGVITRYREDIDRSLRIALEEESRRLRSLDVPPVPDPFQRILSRAAPIERTWTGPAFALAQVPVDPAGAVRAVHIDDSNAWLFGDFLESWMGDVTTCAPMLAIIMDGRAVSVCASVRRSAAAHEAGVETAPQYRGRGLAPRAVAAWARAVLTMDRVPLYSTSWQNEASRNVARKLGMTHFGNDLHIT